MHLACALAISPARSQQVIWLLWQALASAYDAADLGGVQAEGGRLLALLDDMEELLASNRRARVLFGVLRVMLGN